MYRVAKNIPMPIANTGRAAMYEFPELEIGHSFLVMTEKEVNAARNRFYSKKQSVSVRREDDGSFRIWRKT